MKKGYSKTTLFQVKEISNKKDEKRVLKKVDISSEKNVNKKNEKRVLKNHAISKY